MEKYCVLEDVKGKFEIAEYYCANAVEKRYECKTLLVYNVNGGFGMNYRYCNNCYRLWDRDKDLNLKNKKKHSENNDNCYILFSS